VRRALRLTGWVGVSLALAAFFFVLWTSLQVRQAIDEGALSQPVWSCLSPRDTGRLDQLADRAFAHSVHQHLAPNDANSSSWHWLGLIAYIGTQISYSEAERLKAMRPMLASLPMCPR
jgi:hypothetical protein